MSARMSSRSGFTLVECMLASSIICFSCLVLFEGVGVCSRIARENARLLAAEAVAWDAAWKRFNEAYDNLVINEGKNTWVTLPDAAAPMLLGYDTKPKIKIEVKAIDTAGWRADLKVIKVDVEWGPAAKRKKLSDTGRDIRVCRGSMGRTH